jgi:septal ring factor EnvC (AmiA/AmiB activator)
MPAFSIHALRIPCGLFLLCALLLTKGADATTLLLHTQQELDSLEEVQSSLRSQLQGLERDESQGQSRIQSLEKNMHSNQELLGALGEESLLLEVQIKETRQEIVKSNRALGDLNQRRENLLLTRDSLRTESKDLIQRLHRRRHLSPLVWFLASTDSKELYRRARWFPWFAKGVKKRFLALDSMDAHCADLELKTNQLQRFAQDRAQTLKRGKARSLSNQEDISQVLVGLNQSAKERRAGQKLLLKEKEFALFEANETKAASQSLQQEFAELQRRWQHLEQSKQAERARLAVVESKLDSDQAHKAQTQDMLRELAPSQAPSLGKFLNQKGKLPRPVRGKLTRAFGLERNAQHGTQIESTGCDYLCAKGAQVQLVHAGQVERLTWIPAFGNTLLVRHDPESFTVYTHLETLRVHEGQHLSGGEILGALSHEKPTLHFELWRNGAPKNPENWFHSP